MLRSNQLIGFGAKNNSGGAQFPIAGTQYLNFASPPFAGPPADSGQAILSFWFLLNDTSAQWNMFTCGGTFSGNDNINFVSFNRNNPGVLEVDLDYNGFTNFDVYQTNAGVLAADGNWHHLIMSWDTNHAANSRLFNCYLDASPVTFSFTEQTGPAFIHHYAADTVIKIASSNGGTDYTGALAEYYYQSGTYMDFSVSANLQKFRTVSGHPANLGSDGSLPTGTQPVIYLNQGAANFIKNRGNGGNFSLGGTGNLTIPAKAP